MYGDGRQVRDFTFVGDVVDANVQAATRPTDPGFVANIAGGSAVSLQELIRTVESLVGQPIAIDRHDNQPGDVIRTGADTTRAVTQLQWSPKVSLDEGLRSQIRWQARRA